MLSEYETEFLESNWQMNKENREPAAKRAKINKQTEPAATMNSEENVVRFYNTPVCKTYSVTYTANSKKVVPRKYKIQIPKHKV